MSKNLAALTVAALVAVGPAHADKPMPELVGTLRNDAGGIMSFYSRTARMCAAGMRLVVTRARTGDASLGCWEIVGDDFVIQWADGDWSSFPGHRVEPSAEMLEWVRAHE